MHKSETLGEFRYLMIRAQYRDGSKETVHVRGFTSDGYSWTGEWKKLSKGKWEGTASGKPATFELKGDSMRYEDSTDGTPWLSEFSRKKK